MIELSLPGARVAFTTRLGGVSEGPYESLNLGFLTDDVPEAGGGEPRVLAGGNSALDPAAIAMGWQVHGTAILRWAPAATGLDGFASPGAELPKVDGH